jgi:hypothetical protein
MWCSTDIVVVAVPVSFSYEAVVLLRTSRCGVVHCYSSLVCLFCGFLYFRVSMSDLVESQLATQLCGIVHSS